MTPLIRFAAGLVLGGLAVKTLRSTVFQVKTPPQPSDASPDTSPGTVPDTSPDTSPADTPGSSPALGRKRAAMPARKRGKAATTRHKTSP